MIFRLLLAVTLLLVSLSASLSQEQKIKFIDVTSSHLISNNVRNNTMDAQIVDIDNDGDTDVLLAMEYNENVILINNGEGKLSDKSEEFLPRIKRDSEDIAIGDFDNDGDIDIIFVSEDDKINEFYINEGEGKFKDNSVNIPVEGISNAIEAADFDYDGDLDLIIGNAGQNTLLVNNGQGLFVDESESRLPPNLYTTQDIDIGDINMDGYIDIVEGNETYNRVLINNGKGFFRDESNERISRINDQTREIDLGDIDNDGDLDIAIANVDFGGFGNPQNRLLLNTGSGYFEEITANSLPISNYRTVDIDLVDLNADNYLDILSGNRFNGNTMIVLINDGHNRFVDQTENYFVNLNIYAFDFQIADFNGDGIIDIYICGFRGPDKLFFGTHVK